MDKLFLPGSLVRGQRLEVLGGQAELYRVEQAAVGVVENVAVKDPRTGTVVIEPHDEPDGFAIVMSIRCSSWVDCS